MGISLGKCFIFLLLTSLSLTATTTLFCLNVCIKCNFSCVGNEYSTFLFFGVEVMNVQLEKNARMRFIKCFPILFP